MATFPDGKFYACTDPETLTHEHPWDALEEYLDADLHPRMTAAEVVACIRARPITVTAYNPMEIGDRQIAAWADALHEKLGEDFCEEHGNPEDGPCDAFPADSEEVMRAAVTSIIRRSHVWGCEDAGKVTLTPDEIEALARQHRPDWFASPSTKGGGTTPSPSSPAHAEKEENRG
jgi:diketogulonate reductase-like aldo/keto reductase